MMYRKVLVLGGTGFVGNRMKIFNPNWIYASSKDCNLVDRFECNSYFRNIMPDAIVHLAARVGGIKDNANHQAEFYYKNIMINTNVIN